MSEFLIRDESARSHFTMIPNCVIDNPELSHTALRLYIWYKRVCGDGRDGQCYQSLKTICAGCSMRRSSAIDARRELETACLVRTEKSRGRDGGERVTVIIIDIWAQNEGKYRRREGGPNGILRGSEWDTEGGPNGILKEDPLKKIQIEETEGGSDEPPNGVRPVNGSNGKHPTKKQNGRFYDQTTMPVKNPKPGLSSFHLQCGERFKSILTRNDRKPGNQNRKTLAEGFRLLEIVDKVPRAEIITVLKWYRDNFAGQYVPKVYKSIDFRDRWNKLRDAMQTNGYQDETEEESYSQLEWHPDDEIHMQ